MRDQRFKIYRNKDSPFLGKNIPEQEFSMVFASKFCFFLKVTL